MHFARLVEQASVTRFCDLYVYYRLGCDLFVYGAYMVHRSMRVGTVRALVVGVPLSELILIELPG